MFHRLSHRQGEKAERKAPHLFAGQFWNEPFECLSDLITICTEQTEDFCSELHYLF